MMPDFKSGITLSSSLHVQADLQSACNGHTLNVQADLQSSCNEHPKCSGGFAIRLQFV